MAHAGTLAALGAAKRGVASLMARKNGDPWWGSYGPLRRGLGRWFGRQLHRLHAGPLGGLRRWSRIVRHREV